MTDKNLVIFICLLEYIGYYWIYLLYLWIHFKILEENQSGEVSKSETRPNQQSADELHKSNIRKFQKGKVYWSLMDNILGANLANMKY